MDGERAIYVLKEILDDEITFCTPRYKSDGIMDRIEALRYAIENIRFRMAKESEERGEDNG